MVARIAAAAAVAEGYVQIPVGAENDLAPVMVAIGLAYFKNNGFAAGQRAVGIVRVRAVASHDSPARIRSRVIHVEIAVRRKVRVKRKPQKPFFVALIADPAPDVEKNGGGAHVSAIVEHLYDARLLDHEHPARPVPRRLKIHGPREPEIRKRFFEP